jgi:signal transduction histidine kinase
MSNLSKLKSKVETAQSPKEKVDALNQLASVLTIDHAEYRAGLATAQEANALAKSIQYEQGINESDYIITVSLARLGQNEEAARRAKIAIERYEKANDEAGLAKARLCLGTIYYAIGEYAMALGEMQKSLSLYQKLHDSKGEMYLMQNIGSVYLESGNLSLAQECFEYVLSAAKKLDDRTQQAMALGNIGVVHEKLGNHEKALEFHRECMAIVKSLNSMYHLAVAHCNLGLAYSNLGQLDEASQHLQQSLELSQKIGLQYIEAYSYYAIGCLSSKANDRNGSESTQTLQTALKIAEKIHAKDLIAKIYLELAESYAKAGKYEQAFLAHKAYHAANRELFSEESDRRLKVMGAVYEVEQAKMQAEIYRLRNVELIEANQLKTELMSIAAHDLRNPLQAIIGFSELMLEQLDERSELYRMTSTIYSAAQRMHELITDLLEMSALDAGKIVLHKELTDVSSLAINAVSECKVQADAKKQVIECSLEPNVKAKVDAARLKEVFVNLISNAIKYSPCEKVISVSLKHAGEKFRFEVKDEGQGLTPDDMKRLFMKFQRLSAKPTGGESSTGLGLAIVKQIVELHNGQVWAESAGKDKGATFIVEVPTE